MIKLEDTGIKLPDDPVLKGINHCECKGKLQMDSVRKKRSGKTI